LTANDFTYIKLSVAPHELEKTFDALEQLGCVGGNITLPYKVAAMPFLLVDEATAFIGAVNTFVLRNGKRYGYNTDWQGVVGALASTETRLDRRRGFVILGSGGAARAAIYGARRLGFDDISVFYRVPIDDVTVELRRRTQQLGIRLAPYEESLEQSIRSASVIYITTPTGMSGFAEAPFDLSRLDKLSLEGKIAADAVVSRSATPFLSKARERGATVVDGLWWTVFQGYPAFNLWLGKRIEPTHEQLRRYREAMEHGMNLR